MSEPRKAPPYTEEQTTEWLAWLAYNMQQRDQTIFQIENLQPNWLAGRKEVVSYLFLTRILWGMLSGLIVGLIVGLISGLNDGISVELSFGLSTSMRAVLKLGLRDMMNLGLIIGLFGGSICAIRDNHAYLQSRF